MPHNAIFEDLNARRPYLENHIHSVTRALGFYAGFDELAQEDIAVTAKKGARSLRTLCLSSMLISSTALFAKSKCPDDVSFEYFHRKFSSEEFCQFCTRNARKFGDNDQEKDRYEKDAETALKSFSAKYTDAMKLDCELRPLRNKAIAHISTMKYKRPTVGAILKISEYASSIYQNIEFVLTGADVYRASLKGNAHMEVKSIARIGASRGRILD